MKSMPFKSACRSDPYYKRLTSSNPASFWKITESIRVPSDSFKNLIEAMLTEDPHKRISLQEIKHHHWFTEEQASLDSLRLELSEPIDKLCNELQIIARSQLKKMKETEQFTPCKLVSYGDDIEDNFSHNSIWLLEMKSKFQETQNLLSKKKCLKTAIDDSCSMESFGYTEHICEYPEENIKKMNDPDNLMINQNPCWGQKKATFARSFHSAQEKPTCHSNYTNQSKNKKINCQRKLKKEISHKKSHTMCSESSLSNSSDYSSGLEFYEKK